MRRPGLVFVGSVMFISALAEAKDAGVRLSADYVVEVNGKAVPVYTAAVSPDARQAPLNLNEFYSFAGFECSGPVEVVVRSSEPLSELSVRSVHEKAPAKLEGNTATFTLEKNGNYLIERNGNGRKDPLLLFANPESERPDGNDPNVIYFEPGRHEAGLISLSDHQTLYIESGAIVTGRVEARGDNIRICGTGVLEHSGEEYDWRHMVLLEGCTRTRVEGVVLRKHSRGWTFKTVQCEGLNVSNMKIVGSHSYNDDGIDLCNSRKVRINNCFIRTNDDAFAFKGMDAESRTNCEDITVTNCMMWSDLCCTILLGDECRADYMRNIVFRDCFVPYLSYEKYLKKFLMLHACEEMRLENVLIENIEIRGEGQNRNYIEIACEFNQWCETETAGYIKDVVLKNVHLTGEEGGYQVVIKGFDEKHTVEEVRFENCTINGRPITAGSSNVTVGAFTKNVVFQD
jgi:hypothetical protein